MTRTAIGESMETQNFHEVAPPPRSEQQQRYIERDRVIPKPFISCVVSRIVNRQAEEFQELADFQAEIGRLNDGYIENEDGTTRPRFDFEDYHSSMVKAESIHVSHLYAADIGDIVVRNFCEDDGRIIRPREVKKRILRFTKKYRTTVEQRNVKMQEQQMAAYGLASNGNHRTLGDDALLDGSEGMTNGIFPLEKRLGTFGRGNAFALTFTDESRRFLQEERAWSLGMAVDMLGVDRLDRDIEDRILSSPHHATIIRLGLKLPEWEVTLPAKGIDAIPDTFVTGFDPKAKPILPNAD